MAYQFTANPAQGQVDVLPNGRKLQFNGGKWDIFVNTLPQNVSPVINATPPIESATAPTLPNANKYWFDTASSIMHYQHGGAWVAMAGGSGGSSTPVPPLVAATAPALPNSNPFWFNSTEGVLYVQKVAGEVRSWERCSPEVTIPDQADIAPIVSDDEPELPNTNGFWFKPSTGILSVQKLVNGSPAWTRSIPEPTPTAVPPIESETVPTIPNANPYWFKPSTSVLHYQYNDGNSTQWVEV